ncbi:unnamed protein product [Vitrella brassicaformis CCMP3155]|uniref:Uncharacterized protein n=2 Tax=Vitrella brassicaformis TaxID=1169539 RepID=A0A0G4FRY2_VITBC|nr:unnamed protein product [Vitrella brassicaformis CCMP3155]|mmetsp:Transcript_53967/g.135649  ORF Transcript_53967/g.135649 Transcript_53967/m.135649 type:complete len:222 (+) Transcript_53967:115-780(+)|eukprot:CEM17427.1 unnamed protein product [Vitrella brassicaformis CCMP3155]
MERGVLRSNGLPRVYIGVGSDMATLKWDRDGKTAPRKTKISGKDAWGRKTAKADLARGDEAAQKRKNEGKDSENRPVVVRSTYQRLKKAHTDSTGQATHRRPPSTLLVPHSTHTRLTKIHERRAATNDEHAARETVLMAQEDKSPPHLHGHKRGEMAAGDALDGHHSDELKTSTSGTTATRKREKRPDEKSDENETPGPKERRQEDSAARRCSCSARRSQR